MFSQKFLIPRITQVYGFYLNEIMAVQRKRVNEYVHRLAVAGLPDRRDRIYPMLRPMLDPHPTRSPN